MQRNRTRQELLTETYLNKSQIAKLFSISFKASKRIYDEAMRIEEQSNKFRIFENKVKLANVCKVMKVSYNMLAKQVNLAVEG